MAQDKNVRIILISGGSVFLAPKYSLPQSGTSLDPMKMRFKAMNYFSWELLNSHAIYLWSFYQTSGTPLQHYKKVEQIIATF